jgi:hypothetical protein
MMTFLLKKSTDPQSRATDDLDHSVAVASVFMGALR